jgi:putative restriction endonuclease
MVRYWWVNHNQTASQEIDGQYLWSPKTESNGARSEFYNNMRRVSPGDIVLSYSRQAVRFIGRVAEFAFTAPKPEEFGTTGGYWNNEGWLLPVFWIPLSQPVRPRDMIGTLRPLLPDRYSPLQGASGAGNQKAYLAEVSEPLFETVTANSMLDWPLLMAGGANSLSFEVVVEALDDAAERQIAASMLEDTVRKSVIQARRGQGLFRRNVETRETACRLTGITNPTLLIASHIKPWRSCTTAAERLDGFNGLMLTPDADLLFDRGLVSFDPQGSVMVSPRADPDDLRRLGFEHLAWKTQGVEEAPASWLPAGLAHAQQDYMAYHRSEIFIA